MPTNITHNQPIKISGQHNIYDVGYKDIYKDDSQSDIYVRPLNDGYHLLLLCELTLDQLVRSLVVESTHLGSSPQLGTGARIFLDLF